MKGVDNLAVQMYPFFLFLGSQVLKPFIFVFLYLRMHMDLLLVC